MGQNSVSFVKGRLSRVIGKITTMHTSTVNIQQQHQRSNKKSLYIFGTLPTLSLRSRWHFYFFCFFISLLSIWCVCVCECVRWIFFLLFSRSKIFIFGILVCAISSQLCVFNILHAYLHCTSKSIDRLVVHVNSLHIRNGLIYCIALTG